MSLPGLLWPVPDGHMSMMHINTNPRAHVTTHVGLREPVPVGSYLPLRLYHRRSSKISTVDLEKKP